MKNPRIISWESDFPEVSQKAYIACKAFYARVDAGECKESDAPNNPYPVPGVTESTEWQAWNWGWNNAVPLD